MKKVFLLPEKFKRWGMLLFALSVLWGIYLIFIEESAFGIIVEPLQALKNNIAIIGTLIGLCLVAFSREHVEDELVMSLRMDSMIKSLMTNSFLVILFAVFCYGGYYLYCLLISQYTVLLLYIIIFRYNMYIHLNKNEE